MMWLNKSLHLAQYHFMQMILLFIIYNIRLPADYPLLQADITAIVTFVEEEKHLNFNTNKCSFILISRKHSLSITPPPLFIKAGVAVEQVDSVKHLGVLLTSDLMNTLAEFVTKPGS